MLGMRAMGTRGSRAESHGGTQRHGGAGSWRGEDMAVERGWVSGVNGVQGWVCAEEGGGAV